MPYFNIIKTHKPTNSFRVESVKGTFDLTNDIIKEEFQGNIDLPEKWSVGLIVGRSGTGKTTIAKELFNDIIVNNYEYINDNVLDDMPKDKTVVDICKAFNSVGFSSPPNWLKPYGVLSNGEKMRVDLARSILENNEIFAFDEFTSVVDREVAKIGSFAMQKAIRKTNKKFIAITCHHDVEDWLLPDWVFNTDLMEFYDYSSIKKKDQILTSKYMKQKKNNDFGKCLVNIII